MAITKVWLDESENECTMCGACEATCPEVFEVPEKMVVKAGAKLELTDEIVEAAEGAFDRLVVCAAPQTLGDLRNKLSEKTRTLTTAEIDKNFSNLPTDKLISSVRSIMFDA